MFDPQRCLPFARRGFGSCLAGSPQHGGVPERDTCVEGRIDDQGNNDDGMGNLVGIS